jgi:hypothetical protein
MKFKNSFKYLIYLSFIFVCFPTQKAMASFHDGYNHITIKENRSRELFVYHNNDYVGPIKRHQLIRSLRRLNYWPFREKKGYVDPVIIPLQILLVIKLLHPELLSDLPTHYLALLDIAFSYFKYRYIQKALAETPNADNESYEMDEILAVCTGISPLLGILAESWLRRTRADMLRSSKSFRILATSADYLKSIEKYTHPKSWLKDLFIIKYLQSKFKA